MLIWIALAMHVGMEWLSQYLLENEVWFLDNQEFIAEWLEYYKLHTIVWIYLMLLILIFSRSKIWIWVSENSFIKFLFWVLFAPITVISIISSLLIVIFWEQIFSWEKIEELSSDFWDNEFFVVFLQLMPLRVILPALMAVLLSTEIKLWMPKLFKKAAKKSDSTSQNWENEDTDVEKK